MLKLRDIMTTEVVTVTPQTTLREMAELFDHHHVSGAPVVEGTRVVGVVSASDLLGFASSEPLASRAPRADAPWDEWNGSDESDSPEDEPTGEYFTELWAEPARNVVDEMEPTPTSRGALDEHTVDEIMTHKVLGMAPSTDVTRAADLMRRKKIHRVLVVDNGTLIGVVSALDIVRAVADQRLVSRTYVFNRDEAFDDREE